MTVTSPTASPALSRAAVVRSRPGRLFFIDNIRVFLTILVILHHLMVIYAGSGSWIYSENQQDGITAAVGRWFCSVNQSYFMGLFLFISAYFVPGAYDRKGTTRFLKDRLIRLGIPLAAYGWVIRPLWIFKTWQIHGSFWKWYAGEYFKYYGIIGGGPLWFIEVLLIFASIYALYRMAFAPRPVERIAATHFPGSGMMILFAFLLGMASFVVRIWFPQNTSITELNLQLANFPQYIALFSLGLYAYSQNWFASLPAETARRWMIVALSLSVLPPLVGFDRNPQADLVARVLEGLVSAMWESFMCVAMCISVVFLFRSLANQQGRVAGWLSHNAYTAYLIHELIITSIALGLASAALYPLLKFALMGLITIPLTFLLSALIRKIPYTDRVL